MVTYYGRAENIQDAVAVSQSVGRTYITKVSKWGFESTKNAQKCALLGERAFHPWPFPAAVLPCETWEICTGVWEDHAAAVAAVTGIINFRRRPTKRREREGGERISDSAASSSANIKGIIKIFAAAPFLPFSLSLFSASYRHSCRRGIYQG